MGAIAGEASGNSVESAVPHAAWWCAATGGGIALWWESGGVADGVGFEPTVGLPPRQFSRLEP